MMNLLYSKVSPRDNTCIETVVTHFPVYHTAEVSILNWYPPLHTAAAIIVGLAGGLACLPMVAA